MDRRGISPIIATVLILVIVFVLISIIAVFSVPFVRESLSGSEDCLEVLGNVKFDDSAYNCNIEGEITGGGYIGNEEYRTGFSVKVDGEKIAALRIALFNGGSSDIVNIEPESGILDPEITMLGQEFPNEENNLLKVPERGGVRTYVVRGLFDKLELSAILVNGKICDVGDQIEINECLREEIKGDLLEY